MNTTDTAELNRWREAGKGVGRKVGVAAERKRIVALIEDERKLALRRGAILRAGYLLEIRTLIEQGETQ